MSAAAPIITRATAKHPAGAGLAIEIDNVSKIFETMEGDDILALHNFSLSIKPGEFIAIVGPSGCGKSTLLSMLAGLDRPSSGRLLIDGASLLGPHPQSGMVFQTDYLLPWRSVLDNLLLPIEIKGLGRAAYVPIAERLLEQVGLGGFGVKRPHELSGGMRQRAAICRAIIQNPGLLLMDEPFAALDALTREQMISDLQSLRMALGNTVVFITHGIEEAVFLADRVIVLSPRPGRIDLEVAIDLPRPRRWTEAHLEPQFQEAIANIRHCFERRGVLNSTVAKLDLPR